MVLENIDASCCGSKQYEKNDTDHANLSITLKKIIGLEYETK